MKIYSKIMIGAMIVIATAMQGIAEISFANSEAITIDNTIPEPGMFLLIAVLLIFKAIRKI